MRFLLLAALTLVTLSPLWAQTRLTPSDSSNTNQKWFVERPLGGVLTASFGSTPSLLLGYQGMHDFLDDQDIELRRFISIFSFGFHGRFQRLLLGFSVSSSEPSENRVMTANGRGVYLKQDYLSIDVSAGFIAYSDRFISIIPRVGLGASEFSVQYTFENALPFDFNEPADFQSNGSPNLVHDGGHVSFALEFMNGFGNKKRINGIIGGSIGYRHGWQRKAWEAAPGRVDNPISDRLGELFLNAVLGLSIAPRKSTSR